MRGLKTGVAVVLVVAALAAIGCASRATERDGRGSMRVAIVNMEPILKELPEYRQMSDEYEKERLELYKDLKPGMDVKKWLEEHKDEINKSAQKWADSKGKFLDKVAEKVRVASQAVSKDKKIDIVLVNAPWFPVKQTLAVDITADVIYNLRETGKSVH